MCDHMNFKAQVNVARLEGDGKPMSFMVDITINCVDCGLPFEFLGLEPGVDTQGARVGIDGLEARIAIVPQGSRPNPLQRMSFNIRKFDG